MIKQIINEKIYVNEEKQERKKYENKMKIKRNFVKILLAFKVYQNFKLCHYKQLC